MYLKKKSFLIYNTKGGNDLYPPKIETYE